MLLGEKLKKARKNIGMSQNEVAEELMLSRQTISKWENNVCLPDLENFQRICKLYKVDFNTILSKDEEARVTPSVRAASVRWMPVSGPSTSEAWTGIDEKIQRPQSKELANNFLNFIKCPPFTF